MPDDQTPPVPPAPTEPVPPAPQPPNAQIQILNAIMPQLFGLVREFQGAFDGVGQKIRDGHRGAGMQKLNFIYGMLTALATISRDRTETELQRDFADLQTRFDNLAQVFWNVLEQYHDGEVTLKQDPKGLADNPELTVSMKYTEEGLLRLRSRPEKVETPPAPIPTEDDGKPTEQ